MGVEGVGKVVMVALKIQRVMGGKRSKMVCLGMVSDKKSNGGISLVFEAVRKDVSGGYFFVYIGMYVDNNKKNITLLH